MTAAVRSRTIAALLGLAVVSGFPAPSAAQQTPPPPEPAVAEAPPGANDPEAPVDSTLEERVEVALAEFRILVTDKKGQAVTDLTRDEITVLENGVEQKLAYLDHLIGGSVSPLTAEEVTPAPLYDASGVVEVQTPLDLVLPPKPTRRIIFAFDAHNSKKRMREEWLEVARDWVVQEMRPDDQVAVIVLRSYPQWLVEFTSDKQVIERTLSGVSIIEGIADRDRSRDVTNLIETINGMCKDISGPDHSAGGAGSSSRSTLATPEEYGCAVQLAEEYVYTWNLESTETLDAWRTMTGQLAAVPGQKAVLLFSNGIVPDASQAAVAGIISAIGNEGYNMTRLAWAFRRDALLDIDQLHSVAKAANVSFFTLDTRQGSDTGYGGQLERTSTVSYQTGGVNPWSEMRWGTEGSLKALAKETSGRSYTGHKKLDEKVAAAADSFFGTYLVGYYRSDPGAQPGKVKIKIRRKKLDVDYPDRPDLWPHRPMNVNLDLTIGAPEITGQGGDQAVPIALSIPFSSLPLRRGSGGRGCQLGAFIQAVTPGGEVVFERLEVVTVVADRATRREAKEKAYEHRTQLILPPGSYRIRARFSDDRQKIIADRAIDLTLEMGSIRAGLEADSTSTP